MSHKIKCDICGNELEESDDVWYLAEHGKPICPDCKPIIELRKFYDNYLNENYTKEHNSEIWLKNFYRVNSTTRVLDKYKEDWDYIDRCKKVEEFLDSTKSGRKYLFENIKPHLETLDSMFIKKHKFWETTGNGWFYIREATLNLVFIKLIDAYKGKENKCSIEKLFNILENNISNFENFELQHKICFEKSKDVLEFRFSKFPVRQFITIAKKSLNEFEPFLEAIKGIRDKECAHNGKIDPSKYRKLDYKTLKRLIELLLVIYDGFLLLTTHHESYFTQYSYGVFYDNIENLVELGKVKEKEKEIEFKKQFKNLLEKTNS